MNKIIINELNYRCLESSFKERYSTFTLVDCDVSDFERLKEIRIERIPISLMLPHLFYDGMLTFECSRSGLLNFLDYDSDKKEVTIEFLHIYAD